MNHCNETITVYNAKYDPSTDTTKYHRTVITGASWFGSLKSTVDGNGLKAANMYTVRIPEDASFEGKQYVDHLTFADLSDPSGAWTLANGDYIVHGIGQDITTPSTLHVAFAEVMTILFITDNRTALFAPHWKVVGA